MSRLARILFSAMLASLPVAAAAQAAPAATGDTRERLVDLAIMYSDLHTNAPVGSCNCFWMSGGTAQLAIPVWRNFALVGEAGGHTTGSIPNFGVGLSLVSGMAGLRLRVPTHTLFQPFGHALVGGVHGFDGYFPVHPPRYPTSFDSSFAMVLGGGVDLAISKHYWIRIVQADYHYSQLRNLQGDRQNQFRISGGIVVRFPDWLWERQ